MRSLARFVPLGLLFAAGSAAAQAPGPQAPAPAAPATPSAPPGSVVVPSQSGSVVVTPGSTTTSVYGPDPGVDPNAGLPSSSQPKLGDQTDGFDLGNRGGGSTVVYGDPGATGIVSEGSTTSRPLVPNIHVVRRGDTLWDLGDRYYGNPWQWPRIWSFNPQVTNPHWIYPGDQLRMRDPSGRAGNQALLGSGNGNGDSGDGGLVLRKSRLTPSTVVLRDQGFIGDPEEDTFGELAGAVEEQMLLSEGNHVYLTVRPGKTVKPKDQLTLFRSVRQPAKVKGARKPPGEIVAVLGTVRVDSFDEKTRVARGRIIESLDVIERGAKIGPVRRRFDVVPPLPATTKIEARVLTSVYPHVFIAENQVAFLDRGSEDGLRPGNRLVVMRRGDAWRKTIDSPMASDRMRVDTPEEVEVERTPLVGDDESFPNEWVAELRILRAEKFASIALVTQSRRELTPGDVAVTRPGF